MRAADRVNWVLKTREKRVRERATYVEDALVPDQLM